VVVSASLMAASLELNDRDRFRDGTEGYWRATDTDAVGGMEMMALSTLPGVVPGCNDWPFLVIGVDKDDEDADRRRGLRGDLTLSLLDVLTRGSMRYRVPVQLHPGSQ
jgi:hypothetical protein